MPRTKVSTNSKRNRDAAVREEKIREFDCTLDQYFNSLDMEIKQDILEIDTEISLLKSRIPQKVLAMKMSDLISMNLATFSELKPIPSFVPLQPTASQNSLHSQTLVVPSAMKSRDDEGYLTEDSRGSGIDSGLASLSEMRTLTNTSRIMGPLSSAKANRRRRSRSACGYPGSTLKPKPSASSGHLSRPKMRTPMTSRQKAISADRNLNMHSSPTALLRWPKPGEMVVSMTGSPVVAQVMPGQYANVNIPIRDGVLSLQPKKLQDLDPELVHRIDRETLTQIKLLQSNLELIMSYAHKSNKL